MKITTEAIEEKVTEEILEPLERIRRDLEAAGIDPDKYLPKEEEEPIEWVWRLEVGRFVVGWKRRG